MSSLRNSAYRRNHAERSQPLRRQNLGLLEKHKDYKLRAIDYHNKQDRLKSLREKAKYRNEDEFYFGMIKSKTKDGVHIKERKELLDADIMKLLRTQDKGYIQMMINKEKKQIETLRKELSFLEEEEHEENEHETPKKKTSHTIFVDEEEEVEQFDPSEHFDTLPELVDKKHLRLRKDTLKNVKLNPVTTNEKAVKAKNKKIKNQYHQLKLKLDRLAKMQTALRETEIQKSLLGKGKRQKVGKDALGLSIWKFEQERKK